MDIHEDDISDFSDEDPDFNSLIDYKDSEIPPPVERNEMDCLQISQ